MSNAMLFTVASAFACLSLCQATANLEPTNYCGASFPVVNNCTANTVLGEWALVYSSDISSRSSSSIYGPAWPYDFCDTMNLNKGCMAIGLTLQAGNENTTTIGYAYGYNAFTDVWTIDQFVNVFYQVPGTNLWGYRITYLHYVQVADEKVFVDKKPMACGKDVIRSGPIYRSSNYIVLANDPNLSWLVLLYCDSFYGYINDAPLIQVYVKRDYLPNVSYPFSTMPFYKEVREAIKKNGFNIYANDFDLVYHDTNGNYPTSVNWKSIQWEADCLCTNY